MTQGAIEAIELYWFYNIGQNMQLNKRPGCILSIFDTGIFFWYKLDYCTQIYMYILASPSSMYM
jgi:hypothetical protein